jgi:hypothetical protein
MPNIQHELSTQQSWIPNLGQWQDWEPYTFSPVFHYKDVPGGLECSGPKPYYENGSCIRKSFYPRVRMYNAGLPFTLLLFLLLFFLGH